MEELILAGADIIKVGIGPGDHSATLNNTFLRLCRSLSHRHLKHMSTLMVSVHLSTLSLSYTLLTPCVRRTYICRTVFELSCLGKPPRVRFQYSSESVPNSFITYKTNGSRTHCFQMRLYAG